jgi:hypothetical protein
MASFSFARTTKRFPLSRCVSAIQIVPPWQSTAETQPELRPGCVYVSGFHIRRLYIASPSRLRDSLRSRLAARANTGGKGIRTPGLLIANETLYQLSYTPMDVKGGGNKSDKNPFVHLLCTIERFFPCSIRSEVRLGKPSKSNYWRSRPGDAPSG